MLTTLIAIACLFPAANDDWKPPKAPDPTEILQSAKRDVANGDYETALAKHVWYHENALRIDPAQYGVRLSFALSYWNDLAEKYEAAELKLIEIRDSALTDVMASGPDADAKFHDYASINGVLGQENMTVKTFKKLHKDKPELAKKAFGIAKEYLVKANEYELAKEYFDGKKEAAQLAAAIGASSDLGPSVANHYQKQAVELIELLIKLDQKEIAKAVSGDLSKAIKKKSFDRRVKKLLADDD